MFELCGFAFCLSGFTRCRSVCNAVHQSKRKRNAIRFETRMKNLDEPAKFETIVPTTQSLIAGGNGIKWYLMFRNWIGKIDSSISFGENLLISDDFFEFTPPSLIEINHLPFIKIKSLVAMRKIEQSFFFDSSKKWFRDEHGICNTFEPYVRHNRPTSNSIYAIINH